MYVFMSYCDMGGGCLDHHGDLALGTIPSDFETPAM